MLISVKVEHVDLISRNKTLDTFISYQTGRRLVTINLAMRVSVSSLRVSRTHNKNYYQGA